MIGTFASGTVSPPGLAGATRNGPGGAVITGGGPKPVPRTPLHSSATAITSTERPPAPSAIRRIAGSIPESRRVR